MTKYLVLYRLPADAPDPIAATDPQARAAGMAAWGKWIHDSGPAVVDVGSPTRPLDVPASSDRISGFSILETDSQEALEVILERHPHRSDGSFEVHAYAVPPLLSD